MAADKMQVNITKGSQYTMIGFKGFMQVGEMKAAFNEVTLLILRDTQHHKNKSGKGQVSE